MSHAVLSAAMAGALFAGMLLFLEVGRRTGRRRAARDAEQASLGLGAVDGAVFALLGLLIAFSFSGASARFDNRRHLIVEETNAIGTAYLRLDLLRPDARSTLQALFRSYLDARLAIYRAIPDLDAARAELARAEALQEEIWRAAVPAARESDTPGTPMLLLPALNAMFDLAATRTAAMLMHPPTIVFVMVSALALASSLLAGFGMAAASSGRWIHMIAFAAALAGACYVILDVEFPRLGMIQVSNFDALLVKLRAGMR